MNRIHSTAIIGDEVTLGNNNWIGPHCVIQGVTRIGDGNRFEAFVSVGAPAEHVDYWKKEPGPVDISNNNVIREFCTINAATKWITVMGSNCIMLRGSHLSHDSILEDDVTVSCNVMIGGESRILRGANLGLGSVIHQRQVIGAYSMIGMGSVITKKLNVVPGNIYAGNPAKFMKQNVVGLHRMRVTQKQLEEEIIRFTGLKNGRIDEHS